MRRFDYSRVSASLCAATISALLGGCAVGPDYETPATATPDTWNSPLTDGLAPEPWRTDRWWTAFSDETLETLIERAAANNHDFRIALARVREARAQRASARGERVPQIDATGSFQRSRISENSRDNDLPESVAGDRNLYKAGFDASWELDFFGRIERTIEAADASYQSTIEASNDVLVSLLAEVAINYIDARSLQRRLQLARENAASQAQSVELTQTREAAGLAPKLDIHQAQTNLATTNALIPQLEITLQAALNRLAVLTGEHPGTVHELVLRSDDIPVPPSAVAVGVPADVLRHRPDIRRAERDLAAQTARVGVATAELYPKFTLTGTFEWQAVESQDLFSINSKSYGFGPRFEWNIFDGGRIRNQIEVEDARVEQSMLEYEQTVLRAMEEVENALVAYVQEREGYRALQRAVAESEESVRLARALYEEGFSDFQNLLDSQRSLRNLQDTLARTEGRLSTSIVTLYKALGGGWQTIVDDRIADATTDG